MPRACSIFQKNTALLPEESDKKGTEEEKEIYYQFVLEVKLILGDGFVISIGTEFIENEAEDISKNNCETNEFKRLLE